MFLLCKYYLLLRFFRDVTFRVLVFLTGVSLNENMSKLLGTVVKCLSFPYTYFKILIYMVSITNFLCSGNFELYEMICAMVLT